MSNSASVFWRFAWKEYRVMRGFWLSLAVMAVMGQWLVSQWPRGDWSPDTWYFGLALVVPGLYALACGATMFALEREEATYDFLSGLPATGRRLLLGKLGLGVLGVLAMFGLLVCMASYLVEWQLPEPKTRGALLATFGLAWIEALAWAIFFSLLTARPLKAACLAAVAIGVVVYPISIIVGGLTSHRADVDLMTLNIHTAAFPCGAALAAVVLCVDFWLAKRWLPGATGSRSAAARLKAESPRRSGLGRLVWHHLQQSAGMMAVLGGVSMVLAAVTALGHRPKEGPEENLWLNLVLWLCAAMAAFIGSCVFLGDQGGRQFRFFAEHGARPRYVWLSRQLVWGAFLLVVLVVMASTHVLAVRAAMPFGAFSSLPARDLANLGVSLLVLAFVGYAAGQLASMFLRSGITAAFGGLCVTAALGAWAWLMDFLGVSWAWSVMPIPFWLLWLTWLRAPDWILERNGWKAWLRVGLSLAVPAAVLVTAVPLYRVYSIPAGGPGFSVQEFARSVTPEELATAEMYRRAGELYVPPTAPEPKSPTALWPDSSPLTSWQVGLLKANQEALNLVMEATVRPTCAFNPSSEEMSKDRLRNSELFELLMIDARRCEDEGQLEQALDRYLAALRMSRHLRQRNNLSGFDTANRIQQEVGNRLACWAARPGQTAFRLRATIVRLDQWHETLPPASDVIKVAHLAKLKQIRRVTGLEEGVIAADLRADRSRARRLSWDLFWSRLLFWEGPRALRALDRVTRDAFDIVGPLDAKPLRRQEVSAFWTAGNHESMPGFVASTTLGSAADDHLAKRLASELIAHQRQYRALQWGLAIQAWKIEHGTWPASLEEVLPGSTVSSQIPPGFSATLDKLAQQDVGVSASNGGTQGWYLVLPPNETANAWTGRPVLYYSLEGWNHVSREHMREHQWITPFLEFDEKTVSWVHPIPIPSSK